MGWFSKALKTVGRVTAGIATGGLSEAAIAAKQRSKSLARKEASKVAAQRRKAEELGGKSREAMKTDIAEGRKFGKSILGEGLGRVDAGRSDAMKDVLSRRKKQMTEGMGTQETEAFRSQMAQQAAQGQAEQMRQLSGSMGASGVRGAAAGAQMRSLAQAGQAKQYDIERDLFMKNQQMKREGLGAYEGSVTGAESNELERQKFNIKQTAKEKGIEMAAGMGFGQMGSAERSAAQSAQSAITAAQLQKKKPGLIGSLFGGLF